MTNANLYLKWFFVVLLFHLQWAAVGQSFTKFTHPSVTSSSGDSRNVLLIDLDNNSQPDIHFTNRGGVAHEFYLNFDTNFVAAPSGNGLSSVIQITNGATSGDYNNDGFNDIFLSNGSGGSGSSAQLNFLFRNDSNSIFSLQNSSGVSSVAARTTSSSMGDFDGDGDLDIYVSNSGTSDLNELYKNMGNGTFTKIDTLGFTDQIVNSRKPAWCDYDNDGDLDLFLCNTQGSNRLYRNDDSIFTAITTGFIVNDQKSSFSASWGDYDADGFQDLFVSTSGVVDTSLLFHNNGNGTFTRVKNNPIVGESGKSVSSLWLDVDNDGDLDLFVAGSNGPVNSLRKNKLYVNNGNGNFSKVSSGNLVNDLSNTTGAATADLDRDGDLDLVLSNRNQANEIYFNEYSGANGFVSLNILGTHGKATALNAKIKVKCDFDGTGSRWEYRRLITSTGYGSESSNSLHLGVGTASIVDSIVIEWIAGGVCNFSNININQFYNIDPNGCKIDLALDAQFQDSTRYLTAFFTDSSKGAITRYFWEFGDGNSSTQQHPSHSFSKPGTYFVCLYTFDDYQKWDSTCSEVIICPDTARLGFTTTGTGQNISFTDTSVSNGYNFQWDFGDGQTAMGRTLNHRYAQSGTYNACLYVTDSCRIDTICQTISVCSDTLEANFGFVNTAYTLAFSDSSINAQSILWDFGDGTQDSISTNPLHTYSTGGNYTVCMIIKDACTADTLCKTVSVCLDTAIADFSHTANVKTVSFTSAAQHASSYQWDFGDGNTSNNINPTHTYQQPGTYTACLIVSNDCYSDTLCKTVNVCLNAAQANFKYSDTLTTVSFTSTSAHATGYLWDFGDGSFSTLQNPTYTYQQYGTYNVCLIVSNDCGADTICQTINVCPKIAVADYNHQHISGLTVQFFQLSSHAVSFLWDFDDGNLSTQANPKYAFNSAWFFDVCLTVTDSCGKEDTYCKEVDLHLYDLNELRLLEQIEIYPNPARDHVFIELPAGLAGEATAMVRDVQGKKLIAENLIHSTTNKLSLYQLPKGIYLIEIQLNGLTRRVKILKD